MQKLSKKNHSDAHITLKLMNTLTPVNKAFICILNSNKLFEQLSRGVKVTVQCKSCGKKIIQMLISH